VIWRGRHALLVMQARVRARRFGFVSGGRLYLRDRNALNMEVLCDFRVEA
jgi:hypothetical protein